VSALPEDFYVFDPVRSTFIGKRTGRRYKMGDELQVIVSRVDLPKRQVDFAPSAEPREGARRERPRDPRPNAPRPPQPPQRNPRPNADRPKDPRAPQPPQRTPRRSAAQPAEQPASRKQRLGFGPHESRRKERKQRGRR
jgi:ribonuclease R